MMGATDMDKSFIIVKYGGMLNIDVCFAYSKVCLVKKILFINFEKGVN